MAAKLTPIAGGLCVVLFSLAFVAAPKSCEWGLEAYTWLGVATVLSLLAMPFVVGAGRSLAGRLGRGLAWAVFGSAVWIAGLFAANVRIICRLF